jgi:hypothetical protein
VLYIVTKPERGKPGKFRPRAARFGEKLASAGLPSFGFLLYKVSQAR